MNRIAVVTLSLLTLFLMSCKDSEGPSGPAGPELTGNLYGFVSLTAEDRTPIADRSGVQVVVDGTTTFSITDSTGRWTLPGLVTGLYNLTFSKPGFGTAKAISLQFVGGGNVYSGTRVLYAIPDYYVSSLHDSTLSNRVNLTGTLSDTTVYSRLLIAFLSNDSTKTNYTYSTSSVSLTMGGGTAAFSTSLSAQTLYNAGFTPGSTVYVAMTTYAGLTTYADTTTGRTICTSLSPISARSNFVVP